MKQSKLELPECLRDDIMLEALINMPIIPSNQLLFNTHVSLPELNFANRSHCLL
jgi:hypothetical protein